jgi:imidazolonepropionase-like amidohydrolase
MFMLKMVGFVFALAALPGALSAQSCDVQLTDANVWTGTGFAKQTLNIHNGRFETAGQNLPVVDAKALYLIPPFADAHTHNIDMAFDGPANKFHKKAVSEGVFYAVNPNNIRAPGPTAKAAAGLVEYQAAGGGLTRPGGHPEPLYRSLASQGWLGPMTADQLEGQAFHLVNTPAEARAAVAKVKANGAAIIKLYLLNHDSAKSEGLSAENFNAAVAEAKKLGLRPIVHIENAADFRLAAKAGVFAIMHMPYNAPDADHPAAGLMITADDAALARKANIIVVPTTTVVQMRYDGAKLAEMQAIQRHNLTLLHDAGVRIAVGADNYSLGLHDEVNNLRSFALFSAAEIITMATENGAALAFPERKIGEITPGYEASFVGYFFAPVGNWASLREPVIGMRGGSVMIDTIKLFEKACASAAPKAN